MPTQPVHLQLLDYFLQIWEDDIKNKRPLSFIIPVVVYHGQRNWEQKSFWDYFPGVPEKWRAFVPSFDYILTDLSRIPQQLIQAKRDTEYLRNLFLALKFAHDKGLLKENWSEILTFGTASYEQDRERILLQTLTLYAVNLYDMPPTEVQQLNKSIPKPERNWINEIPEIFGERWKKRGLREGRAEGRAEKERAFTIKTIKKFPEWNDSEVAEFVGVSIEFVQQVRKEIGYIQRKSAPSASIWLGRPLSTGSDKVVLNERCSQSFGNHANQSRASLPCQRAGSNPL
ncbi:MAG: Rpn family recombination-promoting nuclease/putative transposase [Saprospiraceae bacterium]|nr:Rpn family recombination-promoting nuclease/putative transposase [Saprospiraceae bacterium]